VHLERDSVVFGQEHLQQVAQADHFVGRHSRHELDALRHNELKHPLDKSLNALLQVINHRPICVPDIQKTRIVVAVAMHQMGSSTY